MSKLRLLFALNAIVTFILTGCYDMKDNDIEANDKSNRNLFAEIQQAVINYEKAMPDMDQDLHKQLQSIINAKTPVYNDDGFTIGQWTFLLKKSILLHKGTWIGKEHIWHEIYLQINDQDVKVLEAKKKREFMQ